MLAADRIVVGDCAEVLKQITDDSVALIHTSPPYNIERRYAGGGDDRSLDDYTEFLDRVIGECARAMSPGASLFWQTGYTQFNGSAGIVPLDLLTAPIFAKHGFLLWDRIIWRYLAGIAFKSKFTNRHETIYWYVKPGQSNRPATFEVDRIRERVRELDPRNNFWGRNPGNVWEVDRVAFGSTDQTSHVAVYPEEITERIIRACSDPGDLVLDPFAGSGTTPKVARTLGRRWLGIELSAQYTDEANVRIGYSQPSEVDSLLSELIKELAFCGRPGSVQTADAARVVADWAQTVDLTPVKRDFQVVSTNGTQGDMTSEQKRAKVLAWQKCREILESENPVAMTDRLLSRVYKLRPRLGDALRVKTALHVVEGVLALAGGGHPPRPALVQRVAANEPSAFRVEGDVIELVRIERRVKGSASQSPGRDRQGALL